MQARANRELVLIASLLFLACGFRWASGFTLHKGIASEKFAALKYDGNDYLIPLKPGKTAHQLDANCPRTSIEELDLVIISGQVCELKAGAANNRQRLAAGRKMLLNSAVAEELEIISGIGHRRAEKILALRRQLGKFESLDQLRELGWFNDQMRAEAEIYFTVQAL